MSPCTVPSQALPTGWRHRGLMISLLNGRMRLSLKVQIQLNLVSKTA